QALRAPRTLRSTGAVVASCECAMWARLRERAVNAADRQQLSARVLQLMDERRALATRLSDIVEDRHRLGRGLLEAARERERLVARRDEACRESERFRAQLAEATEEKQRLGAHLMAMQIGLGWMVLQRLRKVRQRLAPPGSRREHVYTRLLAYI